MSDVNRVAEIARLEEKIRALSAQVEIYKAESEMWKPAVTSQLDNDGTVKISLKFGGKMMTATMTALYLSEVDLTSATTSVTTIFSESLAIDRLKHIVQPEVERMMTNAKALGRTSKW